MTVRRLPASLVSGQVRKSSEARWKPADRSGFNVSGRRYRHERLLGNIDPQASSVPGFWASPEIERSMLEACGPSGVSVSRRRNTTCQTPRGAPLVVGRLPGLSCIYLVHTILGTGRLFLSVR